MSRKRPAKHVVTIGTFNVFQWGMAGPEAIAAEIRAAKLDVVGLQEVSRGGWRCGVRGSRRRAQLRCGRRCGRLHGSRVPVSTLLLAGGTPSPSECKVR